MTTASLQIDGARVKEGLVGGLTGARDLLGRVRQGVEATTRRAASSSSMSGV